MKCTRGKEHGCLDARLMIGAEDDDDGIYKGKVYEWLEVVRRHFRKGRQRNRSRLNVVDIETVLELVVFENRSASKKREFCSQS
jgi:hypothetical protein